MGTYYHTGATKADIINELTEPKTVGGRSVCTLKKCVKGDVLWAVHERTVSTNEGLQVDTWIMCYLLRHSDSGYGYKPIEESAGPFYYSCPLAYLELAEPENEDWRSKVREYHKRNNVGRTLEVGKSYKLKGYTDPVRLTSIRPLRGVYRGREWKLSKKMIGQEIQ